MELYKNDVQNIKKIIETSLGLEIEAVIRNTTKKNMTSVMKSLTNKGFKASTSYYLNTITNTKDPNTSLRATIDSYDDVVRLLNNEKSTNGLDCLTLNPFQSVMRYSDSKNFSLEVKTAFPDRFVPINYYDFHIRVSEEKKITSIDEETNNMINNDDVITFVRLINRHSFEVFNNKEFSIKVDCSEVKEGSTFQDMLSSKKFYEVEVELNIISKKAPALTTIYDKFLNVITFVLRICNESERLINNEIKEVIVAKFSKILSPEAGFSINEIEQNYLLKNNFIHNILTGYYVSFNFHTTKHYIYVMDEQVYLIYNNHDIQVLSVKAPVEYNESIFIGETLNHNGRKIVFIDDILSKSTGIVHSAIPSENKLNYLTIQLRQVEISQFVNSLNAITYTTPNEYFEQFNKLISKEKGDIVVMKFLETQTKFVYNKGSDIVINNEIYQNSQQMLLLGKKIIEITSPMPVGLMFIRDKQEKEIQQFHLFEKSTLSCYLTFELNEHKGRTIYFDKINGEEKKYVIGVLHVNEKFFKQNRKHLFNEEFQMHRIAIPVNETDIPVDDNGCEVMNDSIVDIVWTTQSSSNPLLKWKIQTTNIRLTSLLQRSPYSKKVWGSSTKVANFVVDSATNPVNFNDIRLLAELTGEELNDYHNMLKSTLRTSTLAQNIDQTMIQTIINYLSNQIIEKYALPIYDIENKKYIRQNILDSDITINNFSTYMSCMANKVVSIADNVRMESQQAISLKRLQTYSKSQLSLAFSSRIEMPQSQLRKGTVINLAVGDLSYPLNYEDQHKVLGNAVPESVKDMSNNTFNTIVQVMTFGRSMESADLLNHLLLNINNNLATNGYYICIDFDGEALFDQFKIHGDQIILDTVSSLTESKKIQITKQFKEDKFDKKSTTGIKIHVNDTLGQNALEYTTNLVRSQWIINLLKDKCNLHCIETDLFSNLINKELELLKLIDQNNINISSQINHISSILSKYSLSDNDKQILASRRYYVFQQITPEEKGKKNIVTL